MKKKREMTAAELAASDQLKAALEASPLSQDEIAARVGVTQGLIWQWANRRLPVPARRAAALAEALGGSDPGAFSVAFAEIASHPPQLREEAPGYVSFSLGEPEPEPKLVALTPREVQLIENYRAGDERTRDMVDAASYAGARPGLIKRIFGIGK